MVQTFTKTKSKSEIFRSFRQIRHYLKKSGISWVKVYTEKRKYGYRCKLFVAKADKPNQTILIDDLAAISSNMMFGRVLNSSSKNLKKLKINAVDICLYYFNLDENNLNCILKQTKQISK